MIIYIQIECNTYCITLESGIGSSTINSDVTDESETIIQNTFKENILESNDTTATNELEREETINQNTSHETVLESDDDTSIKNAGVYCHLCKNNFAQPSNLKGHDANVHIQTLKRNHDSTTISV